MTEIEPGALCYLVGLVEMKDLSGRVVTTLSGPLALDEPGAWYFYTAAWSREMFRGCETLVRRQNLRPIVPPEIPPRVARKRAPETAC